MSYRRILVAVRDLDSRRRAALSKAATIARASGGRIELLHVIRDPAALDALRGGRHGADDSMKAIEEKLHRRLERMARAGLFAGLKVDARVEWDYPVHEAIVRRAVALRAELVVAETKTHSTGARLLLVNTDWELIRACPCPLLLVKSATRYRRPVVLAAIDPLHAHEKPARLDTRILSAARTLAQALHGSVHAFHAYTPPSPVAPAPIGTPVPVGMPIEAERRFEQRVRAAFKRAVERADIARTRAHLCVGDVPRELERTVKKTHASIVVMGAVSRSAMQRLFIGSTAEDVLDALRSDVLIVKPPQFRSPIPARRSRIGGAR